MATVGAGQDLDGPLPLPGGPLASQDVFPVGRPGPDFLLR